MDPGGILALDLATVVGWAYCGPNFRPVTALEAKAAGRTYDLGGEITSGSHLVAPPGVALGQFLDRFDLWLADMLIVNAPDYLVFEAPIHVAGSTSIETARRLMSMAGLTELIAHRREIPIVREVNVMSIKKHWTGNGRAKKPEMIEAARARGFTPRDDNEADALAVLDFAASILLKRRRAA